MWKWTTDKRSKIKNPVDSPPRSGQPKRTLTSLAIVFIIIGTLITLENFSIIGGVSFHWPGLLLILGCGFILLFFQHEKIDPVLLWLGTFIMILGLFFYYLNFTSWASLATLWPVFLGIVGLSFFTVAFFTQKFILAYFGSAFIALFIIFFLIFGVSKQLWPMSLVVFGLSLLLLEYLYNKMKI